MRHEVALLEWGDSTGGVRLLGRSTNPEIVATVRSHLVEQLGPSPVGRRPNLVALRTVKNQDEGKVPERSE